jgi:hypothetical protein
VVDAERNDGAPRPFEAVYPDGGRTWFASGAGPVVSVRFPDGVMVELRPETAEAHWVARSARLQFSGLDVKGVRLDVEASVSPDGTVWQFSGWKTGVTGIDGGSDLPGPVREAALALCRKRAREARAAIAGIGGRRARTARTAEEDAVLPRTAPAEPRPGAGHQPARPGHRDRASTASGIQAFNTRSEAGPEAGV